MNRQLRMGMTMKAITGGACVAALLLSACTSGPCSRGQEVREERYPKSTQLRSKGCVGKDSDGNYRAQGRWEFFYSDGAKEAEGEFRNGRLDGRAWRNRPPYGRS